MSQSGQKEWWSRSLRISTWWGRALIGRNPLVTVIRLMVLVAVVSVVFKGVLIPVRITGKSMEPTYRDGRINFINRWAYSGSEPQRGDVVGLQREPSRILVLKRIVGLPGERVAVWRGRLFINGEPLEENYTDGRPIGQAAGERLLGPNEYFAIGDNRDISAFGVVERKDIRGKVLF